MRTSTPPSSLALLTDLYQLTMAQGYLRSGMARHEAVFHLFFRTLPFGGGYAISCGQQPLLEFAERLHFSSTDLGYLASLRGNDDGPLFDDVFVRRLADLELEVRIDAMPEGTAVFAGEPIVRVQGPLWQCQLLESALLNLVNFQTLIATKATRLCTAAAGQPVLEFGMRRAQGVDGALAASRAAHVGGCTATSNVLAGKLHGIPVKGTHAHSWVMSFEDETRAFDAYALAMPNNCVLLVDTYDTLGGVRRAVEVGRRLRERGAELTGIRLDSGDLARLSKEARNLLDAEGFERTQIVASNDLDEYAIQRLKRQGAQIDVWGVGTRLVTAFDQPALGGVYKLAALRKPGQAWRNCIKLSEQRGKSTTPGAQQVARFHRDGAYVGDVIYQQDRPPPGAWQSVGDDGARRETLDGGLQRRDLLEPAFVDGRRVRAVESLAEVRARVQSELKGLDPRVRRLRKPAPYPVGLERGLYDLRARERRRRAGEPDLPTCAASVPAHAFDGCSRPSRDA